MWNCKLFLVVVFNSYDQSKSFDTKIPYTAGKRILSSSAESISHVPILSSSAESISHEWASLTRERYFQHSKIKFVSPRGHVISSIYFFDFYTLWMQMMAKIVGVTHILINQVRKFNYISILQKEKGVDSNTSPFPFLHWNPALWIIFHWRIKTVLVKSQKNRLDLTS